VLRRGRPTNRRLIAGYARAVLAALMIVVGLLLFTIALANVISSRT
jgi:hypothetical protein